MSYTPRTDAIVDRLIPHQFLPQELIDNGRALERECGALQKALLEARKYLDKPHLHFSTISTVPIVAEPCHRCELLDTINALLKDGNHA